MSRRSPASTRTSSSWARSRSCASSTNSVAHRARHLASRSGSARSVGAARATRSSRSSAPRRASSPWYASKTSTVQASIPAPARATSGSSFRREKASSRWRATSGEGAAPELLDEHGPLDDGGDVHAGVGEDRAPEGMERPDRHAASVDAQLRERGLDPLPELIGGAPVERQRTDRRGRCATDDPPRDARHHRGRLSRAGGCDAQHRTGWRERGDALVRRQALEAAGQGWWEVAAPSVDRLAVTACLATSRRLHARPIARGGPSDRAHRCRRSPA